MTKHSSENPMPTIIHGAAFGADTIAAEIGALINAQARSPTPDEIKAVVAKHIPPRPPLDVQCLTYAEFDARIKARKKHFPLVAWEKRPHEVVVIWADPVAIFVERVEARHVSGLLEMPPRLYVVRYCEENDAIEMLYAPTSRILTPFAPDLVKAAWSGVNQFRAARDGAAFLIVGR